MDKKVELKKKIRLILKMMMLFIIFLGFAVVILVVIVNPYSTFRSSISKFIKRIVS